MKTDRCPVCGRPLTAGEIHLIGRGVDGSPVLSEFAFYPDVRSTDRVSSVVSPAAKACFCPNCRKIFAAFDVQSGGRKS